MTSFKQYLAETSSPLKRELLAKFGGINVVASADGIDYSKLSEDAVRELAKLNEHSSKQLDCNKTIGNTHVIKGRHIALIDID